MRSFRSQRRCAIAAMILVIVAALAAAAMPAAPARAVDKVSVAGIYTVPVEQQWVSRIHQALQAALARGEITYVWSANVSDADYARVMRDYAAQGKDLIIGEAFGVERAARAVAADYPNTAFLMGSSLGPSGFNFAVFDNWIHEPSYLTGMVAGSLTRSNIIGMVGGYALPEVNRLMNAFMEGAREVNPAVQFKISFIDSWYDPPKARDAAFTMIDAGADLMYAERYGVSDAARERGVFAIGNVIDTRAQYPGTVVASALWHMEPTIDRAIAAVREGRFEPADYGIYSFMRYGGSSLSPIDPKLVGQEVIDRVLERRQEILNGLFRVIINESEPRSE